MRKVKSTPIFGSTGVTDIAVASTATVYTRAFRIDYGDYFSLDYKANSANGSIDLKIELEQSVADNLPATEGSSDANYIEPENVSDIVSSLTTENTWKKKSLSPAPGIYARLKITGQGSNNADTVFNGYINQQVEF